MSIYYTLLTDTGAAKIAYNDANALATEFTEVALGDNNGAFFTPQVTDGDCVNDVYRANINSLTIDPEDDTIVIIQLVIPATTGGFTIREFRIYDADGIVIYTGNTDAIPKPILSEGMANDLNLLFRVKRANTSNVTLLVDPSITLASQTYVINAITTHNSDPSAHGAAGWATKVGVQNQQYSYAVATGTTTAFAATFSPAITALTDGMRVVIDTTAMGTNTTTTPTFSPNGLTAHTIYKSDGTAVEIGDMPIMAELIYDATNTRWLLQNPMPSRLIRVLPFTFNGTYTPTAGTRYAIFEVVGGGGGSGGIAATPANWVGISHNGGAGAYAKVLATASVIGASQAITVGAAGAAGASGSNTAGGNGGTSSVGALVSCPGGFGGPTSGTTNTFPYNLGQAAETAAPTISGSVTTITKSAGRSGNRSVALSLTMGVGFEHITGSEMQDDAGNGVSGRFSYQSSASVAGYTGNAGKVIVWEYK